MKPIKVSSQRLRRPKVQDARWRQRAFYPARFFSCRSTEQEKRGQEMCKADGSLASCLSLQAWPQTAVLFAVARRNNKCAQRKEVLGSLGIDAAESQAQAGRTDDMGY